MKYKWNDTYLRVQKPASHAGIAAKYSCVTLNNKVNHFGFQFPDMPNAAVELDGVINSFLYLKLHDSIFLWFNRYLWNKSCQLALFFRFFSFCLPCFINIFPPHQSTCRNNISTSYCIIRSGCLFPWVPEYCLFSSCLQATGKT